MGDCPAEKTIARSLSSSVQLSLPITSLSLEETEGPWEIVAAERSIDVEFHNNFLFASNYFSEFKELGSLLYLGLSIE
ncbi:MAG: hypothetical protein HC769_35755 [Cyanobacteria bacterium CRU_2_1]|nr:hypothetical protein [Cyanobacteria bacterium CRU_2_1]